MSAANAPGPYLAFNHAWFQANQPLLLWALNTPGLAVLVRGLLRIRMADVWMPRNTRIVEIAPNHYTVRLPSGEFRTDFRTHWKYSKRVYYAFKELWWIMHAWDSAVADRWAPAYSFGFLTLTAYPDPDPETATVDGMLRHSSVGETWAATIAGAGVSSFDTITNIRVVSILGDGAAWTRLERSIYLFDTSSLGATATVSAAVMSINGTAKSDGLSVTPDIDIYTATPASNTALVAGDFAQIGSVSQTGAPIAYANWLTTPAYNDFTFSATGRGNVSKTGISKFGARNANYDVAAVEPTNSAAASSLTGDYADVADTTVDPKLVATYSLPGGGGSAVPPGRMRADIWRSKGRR